MSTTNLDPAALLKDAKRHRLVLEATLTPVSGDRFQPAGFPEIGHVIYKAPRAVMEMQTPGGVGQDAKPQLVHAKDADGNPRWTTQEVCIVDSAASMANHLESVMHDSPQALTVHPDLNGLPFVRCFTDDGWKPVTKEGAHRLVVTTLSEGHRLASSYFMGIKTKKKTFQVFVAKKGEKTNEDFAATLRSKIGMADLGTRSHPLPGDWWNVFTSIFYYDPNSLIHGILFPALGIKIPRVLTAHHEAFSARRVETSGVKFDKVQKTNSWQPIFSRDDETAEIIQASFVLDLALLRSFGSGANGLSEPQKQFLLRLIFWKVGRLLENTYRYRSGCDLTCSKVTVRFGEDTFEVRPNELRSLLTTPLEPLLFRPEGDATPVLTDVYWAADELFKEPEKKKKGGDGSDDDTSNAEGEDDDTEE